MEDGAGRLIPSHKVAEYKECSKEQPEPKIFLGNGGLKKRISRILSPGSVIRSGLGLGRGFKSGLVMVQPR